MCDSSWRRVWKKRENFKWPDLFSVNVGNSLLPCPSASSHKGFNREQAFSKRCKLGKQKASATLQNTAEQLQGKAIEITPKTLDKQTKLTTKR